MRAALNELNGKTEANTSTLSFLQWQQKKEDHMLKAQVFPHQNCFLNRILSIGHLLGNISRKNSLLIAFPLDKENYKHTIWGRDKAREGNVNPIAHVATGTVNNTSDIKHKWVNST